MYLHKYDTYICSCLALGQPPGLPGGAGWCRPVVRRRGKVGQPRSSSATHLPTLQAQRPDRPHHPRTAPMTSSSSSDSRVHNLEFSVGGLVREVKPSTSKEATVCWMVNVVRQEGKGEAMTVLARRCMDRFLASLEEEDSLEAWSCSPLLAASCLLVTSKIFSPNPISALSLLKYADNAFVMQELLVSCTSHLVAFLERSWKIPSKAFFPLLSFGKEG